ncbi:DUF6884 domain-containing protein [Halococcus saccharolyticus]|nr:DUF6884 domain-containing protein [Halococcus saccharolyticus]
MQVGLVSCTKSKRSEASQPSELYMPSSLFKKAKAYSEENHDGWYILSAKHHLLSPDGSVIEPYDETLSGAPVDRKREWAKTTHQQLNRENLLEQGNELVFHAGRDYYEELLPLLEDSGVDISIPTEGLGLGKTLAWYNEHLDE